MSAVFSYRAKQFLQGRQAKPIMSTAGIETDGSNVQLFLSFAYAGMTVI